MNRAIARTRVLHRRWRLTVDGGPPSVPALGWLVSLLQHIELCDAGIRRVTESAPLHHGCTSKHLQEVERASGTVPSRYGNLSVGKDLKLPAWEGSTVYMWPQWRVMDPALFTPVVIGDSRLYSSRWYEVHEEREQAAREQAARAEAERLAKPAPPNSAWWKTAQGTAGMRARRS
jgi:hypothetical protein